VEKKPWKEDGNMDSLSSLHQDLNPLWWWRMHLFMIMLIQVEKEFWQTRRTLLSTTVNGIQVLDFKNDIEHTITISIPQLLGVEIICDHTGAIYFHLTILELLPWMPVAVKLKRYKLTSVHFFYR
jgi:hypothetical protein